MCWGKPHVVGFNDSVLKDGLSSRPLLVLKGINEIGDHCRCESMEAQRIENSRYLHIRCNSASRWRIRALYNRVNEDVLFITSILKSQGDCRVFSLKFNVLFKGYWRFKNVCDRGDPDAVFQNRQMRRL